MSCFIPADSDRCLSSFLSRGIGGEILSDWAFSLWYVSRLSQLSSTANEFSLTNLSLRNLQAKDAVKLLHLWLAKQELETRHVKNRSFEGVDARELDLIHPRQ